MKIGITQQNLIATILTFIFIGTLPVTIFSQRILAASGNQATNVVVASSFQKNQQVQLIEVLDHLKREKHLNFIYDDALIKDITIPFTPASNDLKTTIKSLTEQLKEKNLRLSQMSEDQYVIISEVPSDVEHVEREVAALPGEIHVTGTVLDRMDNPLIGVTVVVKGTANGSVTDANGHFALDVNPTDSLEFSYVGYESRVVPVANQTDITIRLTADEGSLNEVVVVAYGTQKKESVTGSLASIGTREIKQSPSANLAVGLAGKLPGLISIQRTGEPGRDLNELYIRGASSPNNTAPLILVDGIERELNYIDPNEVDNITILKDASATALYGVRGANGVILVTTRRGEEMKPEISFSTELSAQQFTRFPKSVDAYEYALLRNQALENDGLPYQYTAEEIEKYRSGSDPVEYPNNDWKKMLIKNFSLQQRYNLNVSGGGKRVRYFVNAGYLKDGGQFKVEKGLPYDPQFKLNRYNFRSNIDMDLNKSLRAFMNIAGYLEKENLPAGVYSTIAPNNIYSQSSSLWILAYTMDMNATIPGPVVPPGHGEASGETTTGSGVEWPPYGQINKSGFFNLETTNITATYGMEQDLNFITKGLSIRGTASFDTKADNLFRQQKSFPIYEQVIDHNLKDVNGNDSIYYRPFDSRTNTELENYGERRYISRTEFQGFINYKRTFGPHDVGGLMLFQKRKEVINAELPFNHIGFSSRLNYGYAGKYFLEFNAGYNGSEQFRKGKRFGFFPAVSGAWLISGEEFLKDNETISRLKLRASYGEVGNDIISGRRFLYLDDIKVGGGGYSPSLGRIGGTVSGVSINLLGNPNVQWEIAKKINLGFEVEVFNSLSLEVDVFHEKRDNILITPNSIPDIIGISSSALPPINAGIVKNHGYELQLNYQKAISNDLSVMAKLNFNKARDKVIFADEPELPDDYAYRKRSEGFPLGQNWGYVVEGYFQNESDILKAPVQDVGGHETRPGDFKYADLNGDGIVDELDLAPLGYPRVPFYTFGAAFRVDYKRFDVSILLQGVADVSTFQMYRYAFPSTSNYLTRHLESWTQERVDLGLPIRYPRLTTQSSPNENANSFFNVNTSYLRLKNMEIGYNFPERIAKKVGAEALRVYMNGFNLLTWDRLPTKDLDPEKVNDNPGVGENSYPLTRLFNFGVNIKF